MHVVLKRKYKTDAFIRNLNQELATRFGANNAVHFMTWEYVEEVATFMNQDPEGLQQIPHFPRPITKQLLADNFFWYHHGAFWFKLSGGGMTAEEALNACAVAKWIIATHGQFIDRFASDNYQRTVVAEYLGDVIATAGYDPATVWDSPNK